MKYCLEIAEFTKQTLQEVLETPAWINGKIYKRVSLYGTPSQSWVRLLILTAQKMAGEVKGENDEKYTAEDLAPYLKPFFDEARKEQSGGDSDGPLPSNVVDLSKHQAGDKHPFTRSSDISVEEILKIPEHMRSLGQVKKLMLNNMEQKALQNAEE